MNIHVVLLGVVLAAFIGLWSNDQPVKVATNIPPVEQHQYDPTGPLSARPTPLHLTSNNQSQIALTLPKGIAPGRYVAVNQLGEVKSITVDVVQAGKSTDDCLLYTSPSPRDATLSRMPSSA